MNANEFVKRLPQVFNAAAASGVNCTYQFNISQPAYVRVANGTCSAADGVASAPEVTIGMDDDDLIALLSGRLNGMSAFLTGKLRVEGDVSLAQRMGTIFDAAKLR